MYVSRHLVTRFGCLMSLAAAGFAGLVGHAQPPGAGAGPAGGVAAPPLRFEYMGPPSAGRIASVAGVPGSTSTYYAGAASGGIWKTSDGGRTFTPIFDDEPVQAIGALAVAPSNPEIVWAGTGEAWAIRDADVAGDGVYKSLDAGKTWAHVGLAETGRIGRIVIHPTNPDIVFVCALGRATGPQEERGVFKTTDGGTTWKRSLFADPNTGCSGLTMDAHDANVLVAGMWQLEMHTWAELSGGPGSAVYMTRDGGATWKKLDAGLPKSPIGKIDVAIAPSDSKRIYALVQTANQGSLWRSDDSGASWRVVSWDRRLIGRAGYYIRLAVNPVNRDEVMVASSSFHRSTDGGMTFPQRGGRGAGGSQAGAAGEGGRGGEGERGGEGGRGGGGGAGCGDCHDIWIDPKNPDHWVQTGDGGMGITTDHARTYTLVSLPIGQMYHVAVDDQVPYWIYSNRQDDGTMRGPSDSPVAVPNVPSLGRSDQRGGVGRGGRGGGRGVFGRGGAPVEWQEGLGGCESGFTLPDVTDPNIVWASCYGNEVTRYDARTRRARSVSPWIHTLDSPPDQTKYRCHWTPPLAIDPFDHNTVYYGCQVIFATSNEGQSWKVISPDLSTQDPTRLVSSGGIIGDNLGQFYGEVVFAIAPSDVQRGLIWAGTNDGKVWYTKDGGATWNDVTARMTGMPPWGTVRRIEPSHFDPGTAYVAVDFHLVDNRQPFIYKTADFGQTWQRITGDLPATHPLDYAMSIAENPNRKGMLFAGTGHGFYYSMDDGAHWKPFSDGLPAAPVSWIVVQKAFHDVVVSTYGRGLFVVRNITRLEQADQVPADAAAYLYAPRPAFRQARSGRAEFLLSLKATPSSPLKIEILDDGRTVVRTMETSGRAGLTRVVWDLRYDPPHVVALRTTPPDNPHIWEEPRFRNQATRPVMHWGIEGPQRTGPIAAPGRYVVRITANGQPYTRPFEVLKDPAVPSSDADLASSTKTQVRIRDDMNAAADMVNRLETMRRQIEDGSKRARGKPDLEQSLADIDRKMLSVELRLVSRSDLYSDDKWYVEAYKVYQNLIWLNGEVGSGAGDVAGGAEFRPTDASLAVLDLIEADLAVAKREFAVLIDKDVPAFNRVIAGTGLAPLAPTEPR